MTYENEYDIDYVMTKMEHKLAKLSLKELRDIYDLPSTFVSRFIPIDNYGVLKMAMSDSSIVNEANCGETPMEQMRMNIQDGLTSFAINTVWRYIRLKKAEKEGEK